MEAAVTIFEVLASVALVVVLVLLGVMLYYLIGFLRALRSVMERIDRGAEQAASDYAHVRQAVEEKYQGALSTVRFIMSYMRLKMGGATRTRRKKSAPPEDEAQADED